MQLKRLFRRMKARLTAQALANVELQIDRIGKGEAKNTMSLEVALGRLSLSGVAPESLENWPFIRQLLRKTS